MFNRIARSIAVLSYMPGGVPAFGQHYEARTYLAGLLGEETAKHHWESSMQCCFGKEITQPKSSGTAKHSINE
jgi:hypothetical protein